MGFNPSNTFLYTQKHFRQSRNIVFIIVQMRWNPSSHAVTLKLTYKFTPEKRGRSFAVSDCGCLFWGLLTPQYCLILCGHRPQNTHKQSETACEQPRFSGVVLWVSLRETGCELVYLSTQPLNDIPFTFKWQDIQCKYPNCLRTLQHTANNLVFRQSN